MTQSMTRLPKSAEIQALGNTLVIKDHVITSEWNLIEWIFQVINYQDRDIWNNMVKDLDANKLSYEAAIECCAQEIEDDYDTFGNIIYCHYDIKKYTCRDAEEHLQAVLAGSHSQECIKISEQFMEKIRSCDNWGDLYDEMQSTSKFIENMKKQISHILDAESAEYEVQKLVHHNKQGKSK